MKHQHAGAQIKSARLLKQWKPAVLARRTGISPSRLSRIESEELYPSAADWLLFQQSLELGPYPARQSLELPPVRRRWFPELPEIAAAERPFSVRLYAARANFGTVVDRLATIIRARPDHQLCHKFLDDALLESGHEALFWMVLLANGAKPGRHSPHRAGFRKFAIIDSARKELRGDLRAPCLDLKFHGFEALLFPQVTIDARSRIFRLDGLFCLWSPRTRIWMNLEIDGEGHGQSGESNYDLTRQSSLGLPTERLSTADLVSPELLPRLESRLTLLFGLPEAG